MNDLFRVDGKVAVVIGGAGGIGESVASGLAKYGAKVLVADRDVDSLQRIVEKIRTECKTEAEFSQVDVTNEESVKALSKQVLEIFGTADILVNAHGLNIKKAASEFSVNEWRQIFGVNVDGTMLTCREIGKIMIDKKKGKIINFSSIRGARASLPSGNEGYCATKGAVDMITRALASEWAPYGINVNAIAPSLIETKFSQHVFKDPERLRKYLANVPLGRAGKPEDVVGLSVFLSSPASDFITGQIIYLDGGATAVA